MPLICTAYIKAPGSPRLPKGLLGTPKGGESAAGAGDPDPIIPPERPPAPKRMVRAEVWADQATDIMEFLTSASLSCSLSESSDLRVEYLRSHSADLAMASLS